ncbi:hypothetical protein D915_001355 [Fasciola hepatica]|uniref:LicD/FKTN/FKRP nucleotidyltransferase domain-containing protein n=1 Tax=Fasciola hepatica TaxID=6192 RepID=A0A4E0RKI4_FASHE|nr:hypothetical protein D915_001355 [Fasciola hepatica]
MLSKGTKNRLTYRYIYLLMFGCLSLIFVVYYLQFVKPVLSVPKNFGQFRQVTTRRQNSSKSVELLQSDIYRLYPEPEIDENDEIVWQVDLFKPLRKKHGWNATQLKWLLDLLIKNLTDSNTNANISDPQTEFNSGRMEEQLLRCKIDLVSSSTDGCDPISLGSFPEKLSNQLALKQTFKENNPVYNLSRMYWQPMSNLNSTELRECSKTSEGRRNLLHDTLQRWILFAAKHRIWWSLAFGSLIGSMRDGNIIPYDTDMDLFILGSDEQKIRQLATARKNITVGQLNLVTRPGPYCPVNPGERMDCQGAKVQSMRDTCSFCGPLARLFMDYGNYIDLFPINIELHTNSEGFPVNFGYTIEEEEGKTVHEMSSLLPLNRCHMMGLEVPCPNHPGMLLERLYNKNWRIPYYKCNGTNGQWESV